MPNSIIQFRVDDELKKNATAIYDKLGIDLPTAVRMFLKRSVAVNGVPFSMILPQENSSEKAVDIMNSLGLSAKENNISDMTLSEINQEILEYRKERKENREDGL